MYIYIYIYILCIPDIRELSGPENRSLISGFCIFCLDNTGSNLGPEKICLISGLHNIYIYIYIYISIYTFLCLLSASHCFSSLFGLSLCLDVRLLVSFRMSRSKWSRKCLIFTQALSTVSLIVLIGTIGFGLLAWVLFILEIFLFYFIMYICLIQLGCLLCFVY